MQKNKSLASKFWIGGHSKFGHQLDEFWKSKMYKGQSAAEVFRGFAKNWPKHVENFFLYDRNGHTYKVSESWNGLLSRKKEG